MDSTCAERVKIHDPYSCPSCGAPLRIASETGPIAWFTRQTKPGSLSWPAVWARDAGAPEPGGSVYRCPSPVCGVLTRHWPPRAPSAGA